MRKIKFSTIFLFLGIVTAGAQCTTLCNFNSRDGEYPTGSVIYLAGKLYGMTPTGGLNGYGCIFKVDTMGHSDTNNFYDFGGISSVGGWPYGSLTLIGGKFYGMTMTGKNGDGNIFCIDTTGHNAKDIYEFTGLSGRSPGGNVINIGGKLYGMTMFGGKYDSGCIFSIDTNGSGYKDLHDFSTVTTGNSPYFSLTSSNGMLYGTVLGGPSRYGLIFSIDTGGAKYADIYDFDNKHGADPSGTVLVSNNKLYGVTEFGGANNQGTIFSINTNGTGYKDMFDFTPYGITGALPLCSLTLSGSNLYGMTNEGYGDGNIISIDTNGTNCRELFSFGPPYGSNPTERGFLSMHGNTLYGMTNQGGANFLGTVFSFRISSCTNNFNQSICIATLDTATNKNVVIWGRTNSPPSGGYGYYNIYRDTGAGHILLNAQPLNTLSEYIDTTNVWGPVSYQISTVDSCGESALSAPHTTIFLTSTASLNAYHLSWTPYGGFTPTMYRIFRGPSLSKLKQIDSVPNNVLAYTDSFPPLNSYYAIEAISPNGVCIPTTHRPGNRISASLSGSFSNGFNSADLGVQNLSSYYGSVKVYPNPGNGVFTIQSSVVSGQLSVEVYNVLGEQVYNSTLQVQGKNNINLFAQPNGVYFYRVITETGNLVGQGKLVIQR